MTLDPTTNPESAEAGQFGRRAMLGKIAAGGALVWASPLVTRTAHAQTAGTCLTSGTLNWNQAPFNTWPTTGTRTASGAVGLTGVTVTATDALTGGYTSPNRTIGTTILRDHRVQAIGGTNYVELAQQYTGPWGSRPTTWNAGHRTATISFSVPVTNVQFHIRDIDITNEDDYRWDDRLAVRANPGATVVRTLSPGLTGQGNGTGNGVNNNNGNAITPPNTNLGNLPFPNEGNQGRATFTISGSVTQIIIDYWSGNRVTGGGEEIVQQIFLSAVSFGCA